MKALIGKFIRLFFSEKKIWQIKNARNIPSMEWSLWNIKNLGFEPKIVIDAGAFEGEWASMYKAIHPAASVLMIEAQKSKEDILSHIAKKYNNVNYHIGLLGAERGRAVTFHINATVSSVLEEYKSNDFATESRREETLDDLVESVYGHHAADLLKLDVQGYELEILRGAPKLLDHLQFILCEVSLLEINKGCPLMTDVVGFMDAAGFIPYDICSFIRRPLDRALWQTDILFIKKGHPIIQNRNWN